MAKPELSLYYHPTTTVYIDDNKDFLNSLTMKAAPGSYKLFNDPHEGLAYIESQFKLGETLNKGIAHIPDINAPKLVLPQHQMCQKLNTLNRFAEPSVVVVDFSMPDLNGLDLCAQITNPNCKKVLLTGVANEKQAIHALNSDLIDFYIGKNEEDLPGRLNAIIASLNARYFMDLMPIPSHEAMQQAPFIFDSNFADYFEQVCEDLDIVEHYYVTAPSGFLLMDELGSISRLIVLTEQELAQAIEEVNQAGASEECRAALNTQQHLPFFQNEDGEFVQSYLNQWQEHLHPIHKISGKQTYSCALIKNKYTSLSNHKDYLNMPSNRLH